MERYNHELMFGVSVKNMKKDERLIFGDSMMTHAMVITAFTKKEEPDEGYEKWRVENSWGEDRGNKGKPAHTGFLQPGGPSPQKNM
ncbi:hypothetical protein L345_14920, partial [Ophiophagus hannah]